MVRLKATQRTMWYMLLMIRSQQITINGIEKAHVKGLEQWDSLYTRSQKLKEKIRRKKDIRKNQWGWAELALDQAIEQCPHHMINIIHEMNISDKESGDSYSE